MRNTISLFASLLVLAACARDDSPKGSAFVAPPAPVTGPTAAAKQVDPDVSPASSILFRECRQAYSVASCTCTVKMVKAGVDEDTYRTMKTMGITGALTTKGAAANTLRAVLNKAYDACARAEDDATGGPAGELPNPQQTLQPAPTPTAKAKTK
jgi:hypothetical protein